MIELDSLDLRYRYRTLFNGYPIVNEASCHCIPLAGKCIYNNDKVYIDEYYGRCYTGNFLNEIYALYGDNSMKYYNHGALVKAPIIDYLRVPYRKIPVYKVDTLSEIETYIEQMIKNNPDYKILFRGQTNEYNIPRENQEKSYLYGENTIKEPSFLPSFSRQGISYGKVISVWHNIASILLKELDILDSESAIIQRSTERFNLFALGIAQHYGLPSIGLDLTDNLSVALWFAINSVQYSSSKPIQAEIIPKENQTAHIYIFRCPINTIFNYLYIIRDLGIHRPKAQSAFFNYCGWGLAQNQLALNLMCAFRVDSTFSKFLPKNYTNTLFPPIEVDKVLQILLRIKESYKGTEIGNILESIYL